VVHFLGKQQFMAFIWPSCKWFETEA